MLQVEAGARDKVIDEANGSARNLSSWVVEVDGGAFADAWRRAAVLFHPVCEIEVDGDACAAAIDRDRRGERVSEDRMTRTIRYCRRELLVQRLSVAGQDCSEVLAEDDANAGVRSVGNNGVVQELEFRTLAVAELLNVDISAERVGEHFNISAITDEVDFEDLDHD